MDIPLLTFFSNNTFLISFGFCAALSFVLAVLINLVRIAYSSCILSEATFEKVKQLKPSVRNHLLWLLNRPLATHFSLNFFQTLFLILTFLFAVLASSNMGMEIWIVCSIIGAVGLLLILVCMLTTSFALSHSVAVLKSTTRLTGMLVRIATFVFRLKKEETVDDDGDTFSVEGLEQALEMQKKGISVLKLNTGNPAAFGFKMPESVRRALSENMDKAVGYCDFRGMAEAREAICTYESGKGIKGITPDDVFIGNGVSELASMLTAVTLNFGDEFLIPSPSYSLWTNSAYIAGAKPVFYTCDESSDWYPDINDIKSKITDKTRAILIINPNNPTGALYPPEILLEIVKIAREHNLIIFSDEIYDRLVMDGKVHTSTAALAGDDVVCVTLNGLSKSHCLCGFRCGWLVLSGNKSTYADIMQGLVKYASMRLCGNALTQLVIPAALADDEYTKSMIIPGGRLYEQREATARGLSGIDGITYVKNSAAFYMFPRLDKARFGIKDDKKFAMDLLHEKHILIVPASGFDWDGNDHFRIVMLPEAEILSRAIADIGDFLSEYHQK